MTVTSTPASNSADVRALKTVSPTNASPTAVAGTPFSFDLEVQNIGPVPALNVLVTDALSNLQTGSATVGIAYFNTTYNSCTAPGTGATRNLNCAGLTVPVCGAGSPASGVACPIIRVTVVPGGDGTVNAAGFIARTNTFSAVSQTTPDPTPNNNTSTAPYSMAPRADVTVVKTAPGLVRAGQNLSSTVSARNGISDPGPAADVGLSSAANVQVVDLLPPNVRFISATPANGTTSCSPIAANALSLPGAQLSLTCTFGTIPPGTQRNVTILVRPLTAAVGQTLTNNVTISTATTETNTTNNTNLATTVVEEPVVDLSVNKSDAPNVLTVDQDVIYTVRVTNNGESAAQNVVVTDNWFLVILLMVTIQ